jgi:hypothetical protein
MLGSILTFVAILVLASPLAAEDAPPSAGRYQIVPDGEGFIRLDTENGALAHCAKRNGAWHCDALAEPKPSTDRNIDTLAGEVSSLTEAVGELAKRLDRVEENLAADEGHPSKTMEQKEQELDQALSFAERLMRRFFDFVRELKGEEPPQRI